MFERRAGQNRAVHDRSGQVAQAVGGTGPDESEGCAGQVAAAQVGLAQVAPGQVREAERRAPQACPAQIAEPEAAAIKRRMTQVGGYQAAPVEPQAIEADRRQVSPVEDLPGDSSEGALAREPLPPACAHDISVAGISPADLISTVQDADPAADQRP
jgi:hypothetical protein